MTKQKIGKDAVEIHWLELEYLQNSGKQTIKYVKAWNAQPMNGVSYILHVCQSNKEESTSNFKKYKIKPSRVLQKNERKYSSNQKDKTIYQYTRQKATS